MAILKVNSRTLQVSWPHWRQANFSNHQYNFVNGGDDRDDMSYDTYDNGDDDVHGHDHDGDGDSGDVNDDGLHAGGRPERQKKVKIGQTSGQNLAEFRF